MLSQCNGKYQNHNKRMSVGINRKATTVYFHFICIFLKSFITRPHERGNSKIENGMYIRNLFYVVHSFNNPHSFSKNE